MPVASVVLVGCATTETKETVKNDQAIEQAADAKATVQPQVVVVEGVGVGFIEPEVDLKKVEPKVLQITAEGLGFPSDAATTKFQKKVTALEAAKYRALVALIEKKEGVTVSKQAKVVDMVFAGEKVEVNTTGKLDGVFVVSETYDSVAEVATVVVAIEKAPVKKISKVGLKKDSLELKQQKAIAAAKVEAIGNLKTKLGKTYAQQKITVENMELTSQISQTYIEGALKEVQFSQPRWLNSTMCEIIARVELTLEK